MRFERVLKGCCFNILGNLPRPCGISFFVLVQNFPVLAPACAVDCHCYENGYGKDRKKLESQARLVLLGTGTGVPDVDRGHTHLVWDGPGGPFLVDTGGDTYQRLLKANIDPQTLAGVLLTHSHCDHINGLPALLFSLWLAGRREMTLPIYGLLPTLDVTRRLINGAYLEKVCAPVEWREITPGDTLTLGEAEKENEVWQMQTFSTRHSRPCVGLRWTNEKTGKVFAYSCDTAPCPEVDKGAQNADVLIHEATTPGAFDSHTSPREAGETAQRAGAKRLILVHYSPRWTMPESDALAEVHAGGFTGSAEIGCDGQVIFA